MNMYAIFDELVGFSAPFIFQNDNVAVRAFVNSAKSDKPNDVNTNPEDKVLWKLGTFNTETGVIEPKLEQLHRASEFTVVGSLSKALKPEAVPDHE